LVYDNVLTRDQLGRPEEAGFFVKKTEEIIIVEEGPVRITRNVIGNSWIVGSSTNGIVGTNTSTQGGGQQVVGSSGRSDVVEYVVAPNDRHVERFTTTNFKDTGSTTATWVETGTCSFTNTQIAQSLLFSANGTNIVSAILTVDDDTNLTLQMSVDGINFETASNGVEHVFTNTGSTLYFKLIATGVASISELIIDVKR